MRTLISAVLCLGVGCTARGYCDLVALGQPPPAAARPAGRESWCGQHPARSYVGPLPRAPDGGELYAYGELVDQHSDTAQCCLLVLDGGVVAKWEGYD